MGRSLQRTFLDYGQDLNSPEKINVAHSRSLHDGWMIETNVMGVNIAAPTANSMSILTVGLAGNPNVVGSFGDGADYNDLFEDFADHDMLWVHGNQEEMPLLCTLISPDVHSSDDYFNMVKNYNQPYNSGEAIRLKLQIVDLLSTSNVASDINMDISNKFASNAYNWKGWKPDNGHVMRAIGLIKGGEKVEKCAPVIPPCAGYYTNMSIEAIFPDISNNPMSVNKFLLAKKLDDTLVDSLVDTTGYAPVHEDYKGDGLYLDIVAKDLADGTHYKMYNYHWGNRRLYVKQGELLHPFILDLSATPEHWILFQADFVPAKGAVYTKYFDAGTLSISEDFVPTASRTFTIPVDLENAQIKVDLLTLPVTQAYAGEIFYMLRKEGVDMYTDTITSGIGDILDGDLVDEQNIPLAPMVGKLPFHTLYDDAIAPQTVPLFFETVLNLGTVKQGDVLVWDVKSLGIYSTLYGNYDHRLTLVGNNGRSGYSEDGDWVTSDKMFEMNEDVMSNV